MSELREDFNKVVLSAYDKYSPPPGPARPRLNLTLDNHHFAIYLCKGIIRRIRKDTNLGINIFFCKAIKKY